MKINEAQLRKIIREEIVKYNPIDKRRQTMGYIYYFGSNVYIQPEKVVLLACMNFRTMQQGVKLYRDANDPSLSNKYVYEVIAGKIKADENNIIWAYPQDIQYVRLIKEKKQVNEALNNFNAPLYHNTDMECLIKMMATNSIKSNYHRGYNPKNTHNGICLTRNKTYNPYTYYDVRITFNALKILNNTRGLKLIPYQDSQWEGLDEYEERLISKNGKTFILNNLSELITEVIIILDRTCNEIIETGAYTDDYIEDLKYIAQHNIFGEKLKIVDNLKSMNSMNLNDACKYIQSQCEEDDYFNK